MVTFRPFHGVSSKVLTVLTFWWLGKAHLKVKEVIGIALSTCRSFNFNIKALPQRQCKIFTVSPPSPLLFREVVSKWADTLYPGCSLHGPGLFFAGGSVLFIAIWERGMRNLPSVYNRW